MTSRLPLWTAADLLEATGGHFGTRFDASGVSIDTRTLQPGDLFVALIGETGDGHDHAARAIEAGAAGVMVHRDLPAIASRLIVDDTPTSNGYYTITNSVTLLLVDVQSAAAGAFLDETPLSGSATQSQQWLLRPAFFRGVDNALLEKQEAARASTGLPWWMDGGQPQDMLQILKNHGVNMVRVRPSSAPPYVNPSQAGCIGDACYAETEAQDLDLAKRAKNLGMSLQLTRPPCSRSFVQ